MKRLVPEGVCRFTRLLCLISLLTLATISTTNAQDPYQRLVRKFEMPELGISNPAGLVYSPGAQALFVPSSQGASHLSGVTFAPDVINPAALAAPVTDPANMAFDGRSNSLLIWDAGANELVEIQAGADGRPQSSAAAIARFGAGTWNVRGARGLTVDPQTGDLFVLVVAAKPAVPRIVRMIPDAQDRFAGPVVSNIVLSALQNVDLRGIAFNPSDGHLYVMAPVQQKLYELNGRGEVLSTRDLSEYQLSDPQSMVFAPSGDQTDDPSIMNLYIADSGRPDRSAVQIDAEGSGDIIELSLTRPEVLDLSAMTIQAALVRTVQTSQWSPPSPDPAGAAYFTPANNLLISDSEVNEMSIFQNRNLFEATLSGGQVDEFNTTSFTDEPTGVAYNPDNQHLYFSDDTGTRSVYELDPGSDGRYFTSDDVVTSFKTGDFSSSDPEGIAYDTFQGHLFVADGVNAEIYEIDPGPNGVFDGVSPDGDDIVDHFDTDRLGLPDPEGVEFNSDTGNLYILSRKDDFIVETTRNGNVVNVIDVSSANPRNLAGLAYGPSSTNASQRSLYIVDRGTDNDSDPNENDGKFYEFSLGTSTPTPSLAIDDVTVTEGDAGTTDAVFTVTLSFQSQEMVTVDYSTENGSATTANNDYSAVSNQLSFSPGETSLTITVQVNGDMVEEGDEVFYVNLSNATNATIGDGQGEGTISDDDQPIVLPTLTIDDVGAAEGSGALAFTVSLSAASGQDVSVDFTTNDDTAVAPDDYSAQSGTLTIPAGSSSGTITVTLNDDATDESAETFTVDLSNPVNATIADDQGIGTILNDDASGGGTVTVSFQEGLNGYSGARDTKLIADSPGTNYGTAVGLEVDGSPDKSALLYWDVSSIPSGSIVQSVDITLNIVDRSSEIYEFYKSLRPWVEGEATWNEYASGQSWQAPGSNGSQDRDPTVLGTIVGSSTGSTTISLNAAGVAAVQSWVIDPSSNHGLSLLEYVNASNGLDFSSREAGTVSDRPMFTVTYGSESGGGEPALSIGDVTVTEGNSGTVDATFNVSLSFASTETVTVNFATADGTATSNSDYASASGPVNFQPGETSKSVTVAVNGDEDVEQDETFYVNLSNPVNATIADNQGVGTISNDDSPGGQSVTVSFQEGVNGYSGARDTWLDSGTPNANNGSAPVLEIDGRPAKSALVSWDLASIPAGSFVQSAEITFQVSNGSGHTYELYEMLRPWNEGEANWNQYAAGMSWQTAGADGSLDRGSTVLGALTGGKGSVTVALNAAGVTVVQSWVDGASSNQGFILQDYLAATNGLDFSSSDNGTSADRPILTVTYASPSQAQKSTTTSETEEHAVQTLTLNPGYPNPFNQETHIEYALPRPGQVRLEVYNIVGQRVRTLVDGMQPAGFKSVVWDGRDDAGRMVGSGVYINRLVVDDQSRISRVVLQK